MYGIVNVQECTKLHASFRLSGGLFNSIMLLARESFLKLSKWMWIPFGERQTEMFFIFQQFKNKRKIVTITLKQNWPSNFVEKNVFFASFKFTLEQQNSFKFVLFEVLLPKKIINRNSQSYLVFFKRLAVVVF